MKNAAPALSDELHPLQYQVFGQVRYNEFMNMWYFKVLLLMKLPHLLTAHILFFSGFVTDIILMHDMFEPVARLMTILQSISIPQGKTNLYVRKLAKWLIDASNERHANGNMDFFPTMKKNTGTAQNINSTDNTHWKQFAITISTRLLVT